MNLWDSEPDGLEVVSRMLDLLDIPETGEAGTQGGHYTVTWQYSKDGERIPIVLAVSTRGNEVPIWHGGHDMWKAFR